MNGPDTYLNRDSHPPDLTRGEELSPTARRAARIASASAQAAVTSPLQTSVVLSGQAAEDHYDRWLDACGPRGRS